MANWLKRLKLNAIALVDRGANPEAHVTLAKRDDVEKDETKGYASMEDCMAAGHDEAKCKALMAAMKRAEKEEPMPDVTKADFEALQKRLTEESEARKASEAKLAKMEEDAKAARAEVAKMQDERIAAVFVAKVEGFKALPVEPAKFAPILRKAYASLTAEEQTEMDRVLNSASEQIAAAKLLEEVGHGGANVAKEPYDKLEKMANELVQKDGKLTFAQAFAKVCDTPEGKKLYNQYEAERAATARRMR